MIAFSIHVPIIRNNNEGLTSTNPLALMLTQEAALGYLLKHARICHPNDALTYRIARYDLLEELACFTYIGQTHYQIVLVDGLPSRLEAIVRQ
ncbi:hypothetical protein I2494_05385 [Budviciaceae bacterium BWR-B9]|uniref:Uncharacterized protein n=1 Tax=Limnobaculum allomyrinae TaxID=2791986 RepID=A0ABS1IN28_9GAMM|nr:MULTISPECIES: hypothetical protein [Limnobaculum]MBK5143151.1 hypothetical protein [Limnobaculum allomyrinae]MBV7691039.1 hypothetical protein [Limnobaculum sp. M2-1]